MKFWDQTIHFGTFWLVFKPEFIMQFCWTCILCITPFLTLKAEQSYIADVYWSFVPVSLHKFPSSYQGRLVEHFILRWFGSSCITALIHFQSALSKQSLGLFKMVVILSHLHPMRLATYKATRFVNQWKVRIIKK